MSKLGYVEKMYGNTVNIVTTNAPGNKIISNNAETSLVKNSLIIASPTDNDNNDLNTPSIVATDFEGNPLRLTYTMMPGEGLVINSNNPDVMKMSIDKQSIITDTKGSLRIDTKFISDPNLKEALLHTLIPYADDKMLRVNTYPLIDKETIKLCSPWLLDNHEFHSQGEIVDDYTTVSDLMYVDKENLVDNVTLNVDYSLAEQAYDPSGPYGDINIVLGTKYLRNAYGKLSVNTQNLTRATNTTYGIVKLDGNTIKIDNLDRIYVDTSKLQKVNSNGGPGIVVVPPHDSENPIVANNAGFLQLKPEFMQKAGQNGRYGVVTVDGKTVKCSTTGVLHVETSSLNLGSATQPGILQADGKTIKADNNGIISVNSNSLGVSNSLTYGVVKFDGNTIQMKDNGQLFVPDISTLLANYNTLYSTLNAVETSLSELTNEFREFKSSITNSLARNFGLYKDAEGNVSVNTININIGSWWGTQRTRILEIPLYLKFIVGSPFKFSFDNTQTWVSNPTLYFIEQEYGLGAGVEDVVYSNNILSVKLQLSITRPGTGNQPLTGFTEQVASCSLKFYDMNGEIMKSVAVTILMKPLFLDNWEDTWNITVTGLNQNLINTPLTLTGTLTPSVQPQRQPSLT